MAIASIEGDIKKLNKKFSELIHQEKKTMHLNSYTEKNLKAINKVISEIDSNYQKYTQKINSEKGVKNKTEKEKLLAQFANLVYQIPHGEMNSTEEQKKVYEHAEQVLIKAEKGLGIEQPKTAMIRGPSQSIYLSVVQGVELGMDFLQNRAKTSSEPVEVSDQRVKILPSHQKSSSSDESKDESRSLIRSSSSESAR